MSNFVTVIIPRPFEDYDDLTDFMDEAKTFSDKDQAIAYWEKNGGDMFALEVQP